MQNYLTIHDFTLLLQKTPELQPPPSGKFQTHPTVSCTPIMQTYFVWQSKWYKISLRIHWYPPFSSMANCLDVAVSQRGRPNSVHNLEKHVTHWSHHIPPSMPWNWCGLLSIQTKGWLKEWFDSISAKNCSFILDYSLSKKKFHHSPSKLWTKFGRFLPYFTVISAY